MITPSTPIAAVAAAAVTVVVVAAAAAAAAVAAARKVVHPVAFAAPARPDKPARGGAKHANPRTEARRAGSHGGPPRMAAATPRPPKSVTHTLAHGGTVANGRSTRTASPRRHPARGASQP